MKYLVIADEQPNAVKGSTVYSCDKPNYGCVSDDSRAFGEEYVAVTHHADGDYPFFTIPKRLLQEIKE